MNTNSIKIKYGDNKWLEGDDFVDDGFSLTEGICSEPQIVFGACEAAAVEVHILSTAASFVGQTLEVYLGNDLLGKYKVVSDERDSDGETRTLTAYDALYEINGKDVAEWYTGINWGTVKTLKNFRDSFFSYLGISQVQTTLPNDSMTVKETMDTSSCSGATIIKAICEVNGAFGHINPNGYFQYVFLSTEDATTITAEEVFDTSTEDFTAPAFDGVLIRTEEGDIGGQYPSSGVNNQYIINGNFLCYGKEASDLQAIAQNVSGKIFGRSYIPYEAELECQNTVALGGKVTIPTAPATFTSYVLQRKLVGVGNLEEYYAAQGTSEYTADVNSTRNQMVATSQKINKLTTTLDGTISRVESIEDDYVTSTTLEETAKGFTASIEEIDKELQQITEQLDGEVTSYEVEAEPKFQKNADNTLVLANSPAIEWTYNIYVHPDQAVLIDSNIPFLYTDDGLKQHTRDLATDIKTYHSYRFVKENDVYGWKQIADNDFGIAMSRIATLEATSESISQTVQEQTVSISSQGTRITTAEGKLNTQAGEIEAKVSIEGGTASTNASWSLKPDAFIVKSNGQEVLKVNGSGLSVNGSGTFSGEVSGGSININNNFIVDSSGNLTAKSGTFSGDITGAKITIGGVNKDIDAAVGGAYSAAETAESNAKTYATSQGYQDSDGVTTIIDGTVTTEWLDTKNIKAGSVDAENITGTTISGKTLSGNTINNGNGSFSVDTNGNMTASKANITGGTLKVGSNFEVANDGTVTAKKINITGGSYSVGQSTGTNYFNVDANGTLKAKNADIEGKIKSSSAEITGGSINISTTASTIPNSITLANTYNEVVHSSRMSATGLTSEYNGSMAKLEYGRIEVSNVDSGSVVYIDDRTVMAAQIMGDSVYSGKKPVLTTDDTTWESKTLTLTSGNSTSFSVSGYKTMVLTGRVSASAALQTITIPIKNISSSKSTYSITGMNGGVAQLTAQLSAGSTTATKNTVSIYASGSNLGTGAMWLYADLQK